MLACGLLAGDTPSRSGRTLLPFVPDQDQECPPLAGMSPESAGTLQEPSPVRGDILGLLGGSGEECPPLQIPLWLVSW